MAGTELVAACHCGRATIRLTRRPDHLRVIRYEPPGVTAYEQSPSTQ